MLSSQTKDQVTFAAMENLKKHGLNIPQIINTSTGKIEKLIKPVGFYKVGREGVFGTLPKIYDGVFSPKIFNDF